MNVTEYTFQESVDSKMRDEVITVTSESETLDAIIDEWVLRRAGRLSIGEALDDDGALLSNMVAIGFDDEDGIEICCAIIERSLLETKYRDIPTYDTYITNSPTKWRDRDFDDVSWDRWLTSIGMSDSFALMARIGPRSAALSYSLAFVLSGGGVVEIRKATDKHFPHDDMLEDLAEENLNMDEFFKVQAAYRNPKFFRKGHQWIMDPVYFRREGSVCQSLGYPHKF
jgi:hypothetical protein